MSNAKTFRTALFTEDPSNYTPIPPRFPDIKAKYDEHLAGFWVAEEVDLENDLLDWREKLNAGERFFIERVLAFFAASDGIVGENLVTRFATEVQEPWTRNFYIIQAFFETIHATMYGLLIDRYVQNVDKRKRLLSAIEHEPCVKAKAQWALKWIHSTESFEERLLAFACVEGIFFSASFCAIFWLKKRKLMPGLTFSNELIARDEGLHTAFALFLLAKLGSPLTVERVHAIVADAVRCEEQFVKEALPVDLIGMNSDLMIQYVKYVADRLLTQAGYPKLYKVENPFDWMELISMKGKTNFFERKVGEYSKANPRNFHKGDLFDMSRKF
jgi:ribonucleoside-diphosphate reductase subunit M2